MDHIALPSRAEREHNEGRQPDRTWVLEAALLVVAVVALIAMLGV